MNFSVCRSRIPLIGILGFLVMPLALAGTSLATASSAHTSCPTRIVSLSPTATESLYAIGAGSQVVAVDSDSNFPRTYRVQSGAHLITRNVPRQSDLSAYSPSAEAIVSGDGPDLVIVSYDANHVLAQLNTLGVRTVFQPTATTLARAYAQIRELGAVTCHTVAADRVISTMQRQIRAIQRSVPAVARRLTYYSEVSGPPSIYAANSSSFIGHLYGLLGLKSIADGVACSANCNGFPTLTQEWIFRKNPSLIFLTDDFPLDGGVTPKAVATRTGWNQLAAVKSHSVYALNDDVASRWGPRIILLMRGIANDVRHYLNAHPKAR